MSNISTKYVLVTGKGGVGKSTLAAAHALKYARSGQKTLLVELGEQSFFRRLFKISSVGYQPTPIETNLEVSKWSGEDCLKEYARYLLKIDSLYQLFFENSVSKTLIQVAPGLKELAILGKLTSGPRKVGPPLNYDVIVVDAFATGHFLALLQAPIGMSEAIKFGPMGEQSRSIINTVKDPTRTKIKVVCLPEELPIQEGIELKNKIHQIIGLQSEMIVNEVWPVLKTEQQIHSMKKLDQQNIEYQKVPMIFEVDSMAILNQLVPELR